MRKIAAVLCITFFLAGLAVAQSTPASVAQVFVMTPKPGMTKQFEDGRKKHMDWHRKQNDAWTWYTWQVQSGRGTGSYISVTLGHGWKDFDSWEQKLGAGDAADSEMNLSPFLVNGENSYWFYLKDSSRPMQGTEPAKMSEVYHYYLKQGADSDFDSAIRKIHEAVGKVNWPVHYEWYSLANGGDGPHYVLVIPHSSYADMEEPEPSFPAMLEKAVGRHDAQELMQSVDKSVSHFSSELLTYRPDLSYIAGK
jgi:hypothetical protein